MTTRRRILAAGLATATTSAVLLATPAWGDEAPAPTPGTTAGAAVAPATTQGLDDAPRAGTPRQAALAYMADHEDVYDVPAADLQVVRTTTDGAQTAVRLQQRHDGVPVFGAQYAVQTQRNATARSAAPAQDVTSATGTLYTDLTVSTTPTVSEATAQGRVMSLDPTLRRVVEPQVDRGGLVVLPDASGGSLTWHFTVRGALPDGSPVRQEVYVDAHVGGVVLSYNNVDAADAGDADPVEATGTRMDGSTVTLQANREADGTVTLVDSSRSMFEATGGQLRTYDAQRAKYTDLSGGPVPQSVPLVSSATGVFADAATTSGAVDAHVNAGKVYEFLADELGRDGVDGQGGSMYSVVNVSSNGTSDYANAFWDGSKMVYGHMDGVPLSVGLDVVGHEMTHGVTEHSAGLVYLNQSGALNEAISDYFGNAIETADKGVAMDDPTSGLVGEYLCNGEGTLEDCALRDLNDGRTTIDDYEMITLDVDNGGVHYNSTIVGGALWDLRKAIDQQLADQIVYRTAQNYLTPLSGFTAMRDAVTLAAESLDVPGDVLDAIDAAFDAHGISEGWEQQAGTQDGTVLAAQVIPAYELYSGVDQEAAQISGDTYVVSHGDAIAWDQGANKFSLTVGRFDKNPASGHEVAEDGAYLLDPSVDSRRVVFTRITADGVGVYGVGDKGQGAIKRLVDEPGVDETEPVTDEGTLAWLATTPDGETDVMVRTADGTTTNLTPEAGTVASTLTMRQGRVAWAGDDGTWVYVHDLASGETQKKRISGFLFGLVSDIQLTSDRVFYSDDQHFLIPSTSLSSAPLADLSKAARIKTASTTYLAQFSVTDSYFAYSSYDLWGALGAWSTAPKVLVAPTADVVAGTASWGAVTCSTGAQLAPALGDGQRAVWLDTSAADTDVVTRATFAGTCA
ncbi:MULTISPECIES: M4 family metallopeptidase [unclassified Isoptericola]|uniref:M4 family metallopeptidase n=1 Tax=unclassified Isoptericola TaxID=2623355 RepID=UPI00365CD54B